MLLPPEVDDSLPADVREHVKHELHTVRLFVLFMVN